MITIIHHNGFWEAARPGISLYCFTLPELEMQLQTYWDFNLNLYQHGNTHYYN